MPVHAGTNNFTLDSSKKNIKIFEVNLVIWAADI
jgi:hypothetical protein